jgi:hypothetical protein
MVGLPVIMHVTSCLLFSTMQALMTESSVIDIALLHHSKQLGQASVEAGWHFLNDDCFLA